MSGDSPLFGQRLLPREEDARDARGLRKARREPQPEAPGHGLQTPLTHLAEHTDAAHATLGEQRAFRSSSVSAFIREAVARSETPPQFVTSRTPPL